MIIIIHDHALLIMNGLGLEGFRSLSQYESTDNTTHSPTPGIDFLLPTSKLYIDIYIIYI